MRNWTPVLTRPASRCSWSVLRAAQFLAAASCAVEGGCDRPERRTLFSGHVSIRRRWSAAVRYDLDRTGRQRWREPASKSGKPTSRLPSPVVSRPRSAPVPPCPPRDAPPLVVLTAPLVALSPSSLCRAPRRAARPCVVRRPCTVGGLAVRPSRSAGTSTGGRPTPCSRLTADCALSGVVGVARPGVGRQCPWGNLSGAEPGGNSTRLRQRFGSRTASAPRQATFSRWERNPKLQRKRVERQRPDAVCEPSPTPPQAVRGQRPTARKVIHTLCPQAPPVSRETARGSGCEPVDDGLC
ncbi:hypothetical protein FBZ33_6250 [Micromonospora sp. A202]|nr:hypothetical protein FBZ33_6250 [Micromonospora sp. A202]